MQIRNVPNTTRPVLLSAVRVLVYVCRLEPDWWLFCDEIVSKTTPPIPKKEKNPPAVNLRLDELHSLKGFNPKEAQGPTV